MSVPHPGESAPDATVLDMHGATRRLADFWQAGPTVLVFVRHFGCLFCREQLEELAAARHRFSEAQIVVVTLGNPEQTRIFMSKYNVPYEVLCDPDQTLYRAYGLNRITGKEMANVQLYVRGMAAFLKGHVPMPSDQDTRQMPGVFIVNTSGQLVWTYRASHPGDHPSIDSLVAAVAKARTTAPATV